MKKLSKERFTIFLALFLLFVLVSIPVWNMMANKSEDTGLNERRLFNYSTYLLVFYGCIVLLSHFKQKGSFIHKICMLWCFMTPIVLLFNGGNFLQYFQLVLWPVIFEMSYLSVLYSPQRLKTILKSYWIIFFWGVFMFLTSEGGYKGSIISISPNAVFTPLLTIPILMLKNNQKYRFFVLIIISFLVLISMKRSGMLIVAVSWLAYVLPFLKLRNKIIALVMIVSFIGTGLFLFSKMNNALGGQIENRINQEEKDTGRNRLAIWGITWIMIEQSSVQDYLVGHGHYGVVRDSILEISAHNDILEVIYDYGLVVFVLYIGLWIYIFNRWWYLKKRKSSLLFPYTISLATFVVMSLVSHLILYTSYFNFLVMFWGCVEGLKDSNLLSDKNQYI